MLVFFACFGTGSFHRNFCSKRKKFAVVARYNMQYCVIITNTPCKIRYFTVKITIFLVNMRDLECYTMYS